MKTANVIRRFKTVENLAAHLNITPQAIYQWGHNVPKLRQLEISALDAEFVERKYIGNGVFFHISMLGKIVLTTEGNDPEMMNEIELHPSDWYRLAEMVDSAQKNNS